MDVLETIARRCSVRSYAAKPVDRQLIEKIVDAGRRAPSARAVEPWEFVVVTERSKLKEIGEWATTGAFIAEASCCIAVFCRETKYYLEDGCAATENILLAAAALGLGACWVAGDKKPYANAIGRLTGAAADLKLVSLIPVGWPAGDASQMKARPLSQVLHWERF